MCEYFLPLIRMLFYFYDSFFHSAKAFEFDVTPFWLFQFVLEGRILFLLYLFFNFILVTVIYNSVKEGILCIF